MRPAMRVPAYINFILADYKKFMTNLLKTIGVEKDTDIYIKQFEKNVLKFVKLYNDNPDLRITQALIGANIIPNFSGFWYYMEDYVLLEKTLEIPSRECFIWGTNYTKSGKLLVETKYNFIKDLETSHIKEILKLDYISDETRERFKDELNFRKTLKTTIKSILK